MAAIPSNSVDYIFTDPPYAEKVQYGELNFVWEAWLDFDTSWHDEEIIVNGVRGKTAADWAAVMKKAMAECYRVLKPGRWLSLCYHDTSEGTWTLVQDIMAEAGFVVDRSDSTLFIDTGQKSYNQINADKATKRDLVINFRKPKAGDWIVKRTADGRSFREIASQLLRDFLTKHPGSTKDRVYDHLVSRMVQSGKMEAHDFEALLRTVAEEASEGRWYLKETADHLDQAEQTKEDGAPRGLQSSWPRYLKKHPEQDGVHYSDLFEQYLPFATSPAASWRTGCPSTSSRPPAAPGGFPTRKKPSNSPSSVKQARCGGSSGLPTPSSKACPCGTRIVQAATWTCWTGCGSAAVPVSTNKAGRFTRRAA